MNESEYIIIVVDGAAETKVCAEHIKAQLSEYKCNIIVAKDFTGADILGAKLCFFGCAKKEPEDFKHLKKVLAHINLSLRFYALFSSSENASEAVLYLETIIKDSDIKKLCDPYVNNSSKEIKDWAKKVIDVYRKHC